MRLWIDGADYAAVLSRHYETNGGYKLEIRLLLRRVLSASETYCTEQADRV
jgi:hypothetical protein